MFKINDDIRIASVTVCWISFAEKLRIMSGDNLFLKNKISFMGIQHFFKTRNTDSKTIRYLNNITTTLC